jgi:transposase-like protein
MSRSTISTYAVFQMFPDEPTARTYLEARLWPNGPVCPECGNGDRITTRKAGFYRCNACKDFDFTVRTGTLFGRSHIPLHKWIYAMYLLVTARKGISSMQLAKEIGVTQKSAWFMLSRLREACGSDSDIDQFRGTIEADECFVGGKTDVPIHASGTRCVGAWSMKAPPELDRIVDQVLAYKPVAKTKAAKRRKRKRQRDAKKG